MTRSSETAPEKHIIDWKLEVVPVPVSDMDRAKHFYEQKLGFVVDLDTVISETRRLVQLTPRGSECSIHLSSGMLKLPPGSMQGLQVVVSDIEAARTELLERDVEISPIRHMKGGAWVDGLGGAWNSFAFFSDPDDNGWVLQERPTQG